MKNVFQFFSFVILITLSQLAKADTWVYVKPKAAAGFEKSEKPKSMKATMMPGFDPATTLEIEANILGYTFSSAKASDDMKLAPNVRKEEFDWGTLYTWSGINTGSLTYSYLCRKVEKSCVKVGPYQFPDYDWATAEFRGTK